MRRCPKCNRTFQTDTQKFCTHDGGLLFDIDPGLKETVQFDSTKIRDAVAKPTTRDLDAKLPAQFDPEATVITPTVDPEATVISARRDDATVQVGARDTKDLEPPQVTQYEITPPAPASGPISAPPPPVSGPISAPLPPPTSDPLAATQMTAPPPQSAPSGPIGTSAPLPAPSQPMPAPPSPERAPSQPLPLAPPKKKSKLPLVLGILAVLLIIGLGGIVAAYFAVVKPMLAKRNAAASAPSEPTQTSQSLPPNTASPANAASPGEAPSPAANEPAPYTPPADAVHFTNSVDTLSPKLRDNYVDFSFYYPDRWVKLSSTDNFIKVERRLPPDFTQENFAAAPWYTSDASSAPDNDFFHKLAEKDDQDFSKKFPEYRKISEGPTRIGTYDGYEFRFEAVSRGTDKGDVTLWGREIFFPPRPGEKAGLKFLILTTSLAPELKSADDVGQKGELPMLLESFRFGKK